MKFSRSIKGYTILDKIRNEDMRRKVKIFCIKDKIQEYRQDWLDLVRRMPNRRLPRAALYYNPRGIRDQGRPGSVGLIKKSKQTYSRHQNYSSTCGSICNFSLV